MLENGIHTHTHGRRRIKRWCLCGLFCFLYVFQELFVLASSLQAMLIVFSYGLEKAFKYEHHVGSTYDGSSADSSSWGQLKVRVMT
jgi:hypothetical protein